MSRIAKKPLMIPADIDIKQSQDNSVLSVKGKQGEVQFPVHEAVTITIEGNVLKVLAKENHEQAKAMVGTTWVLLDNVITGVTKGFERKLQLVGVGYRAKIQGQTLELSLGFSHPIKYAIPNGITIEMPSNTEVVIKGISKVQVGQVAAEIRRMRPPESYKGKGVRYADERVVLKETKKK